MSDDYAILAGLYGYKDSDRFKKILKILINEDEIKLINLMPATIEDLANKTDYSIEKIKSMVENLFQRGYF